VKAVKVALGIVVVGSLLMTRGEAAQAAGNRGGVVHLLEIDEPNNGPEVDILTGALGDHGTDITPNSPKVATLKFSKGTIVIDASKFNNGKSTSDPTNCSATYIATGPAKILSGTEAYAGIKGTLTATINEYGIGPKLPSGKCDQSQNAQPVFAVGYVNASGTVSFG
jgi:hypothetical protein